MRETDARALLLSVTYKGKYQFELKRSRHDSEKWLILVRVWAVDAEHGAVSSWVSRSSQYFPLFQVNQKEFLLILAKAVEELEVHESHEFLRIRGRPITNPHPENGLIPELEDIRFPRGDPKPPKAFDVGAYIDDEESYD